MERKLIDGEFRTLEETLKQFDKYLNSAARKFKYLGDIHGFDQDDLKSIATEGLIKSYQKFDSEKGFRFSTYAVPNVEGLIKIQILNSGERVHFSRTVKELGNKLKKNKQTQWKVTEIKENYNVSEWIAQGALDYISQSYVFMDQTIREDEHADMSYHDVLGSPEDPTQLIVNDFLNRLPDPLQTVAVLSLKERTQREIGEAIGVEQPSIGRYKKKIHQQWIEYINDRELIEMKFKEVVNS